MQLLALATSFSSCYPGSLAVTSLLRAGTDPGGGGGTGEEDFLAPLGSGH